MREILINFISKNRNRLVIILFFVLCFSIYFNSLRTPFVFDDGHMIVRNSYIKDLSKLPLVFTSGRITSVPLEKGMYRPILMLTFAFNYFFGRLNPLGYHIINIMFHFLNGALVFLLLRTLLKSKSFWPAFLASLLFIVHPVNSEAVIYISCRSTLMSSFFFLFGLVSYIKWDYKALDKKYFFSLTAFVLGILTKEIMIVFPLILLSYDFLFRRHLFKDIKSIIKPYFLFFLVSLLYLLLRHHLIGTFTNVTLRRGVYENILTQLHVSIFYFKLFFFPFNLCIGRFFLTVTSFLKPAVLQSFLIIVCLFSLSFSAYKKFPLFSFAIFWYFLNLLPKFIANLSLMAAEHHLYLPGIGIFMVIAVVFKRLYYLLEKKKLLLKKIAFFIFILIFSLFCFLTFRRTTIWRNEYSLWKNNIKHSPLAWGAYNNLGLIVLNEGKFEEANGYFLEALAGSEKLPAKALQVSLHTNLAKMHLMQENFTLAEKEIMQAMAINPQVAEVHNNLGLVYVAKGLREKEIEEFKLAIALDHSLIEAYINLGVSYWRQDKSELAIKTLKQGIKINPDYAKPYLVLAKIYDKLRNTSGALRLRNQAMGLLAVDANDYYALGIQYGKLGDKAAIEPFKKAIQLEPEFAAAHNNLAVTYANLDPPQVELAKKHAKLALKYGYKVKPDFLKSLGIFK